MAYLKLNLAVTAVMLSILVANVSAASIHIYNNCDYAVSCAWENGNGKFHGVVAPGDPAGYVTVPEGGLHKDSLDKHDPESGEVIKCGRSGTIEATKSITQLEWTVQTADGLVWDASIIDGNPFGTEGFHVQVDNVGFDTNAPPEFWNKCWNAHCRAVEDCPKEQAYSYPHDDDAVRTCPGSAVLTWTICL